MADLKKQEVLHYIVKAFLGNKNSTLDTEYLSWAINKLYYIDNKSYCYPKTPTINYHLNKLYDAGYLEIQWQGRGSRSSTWQLKDSPVSIAKLRIFLNTGKTLYERKKSIKNKVEFKWADDSLGNNNKDSSQYRRSEIFVNKLNIGILIYNEDYYWGYYSKAKNRRYYQIIYNSDYDIQFTEYTKPKIDPKGLLFYKSINKAIAVLEKVEYLDKP